MDAKDIYHLGRSGHVLCTSNSGQLSSIDLSKIPSALKVHKTSGTSALVPKSSDVIVSVSKSGETILQVLNHRYFRVLRYHSINGFSTYQEEKAEDIFNAAPPKPKPFES